MPRHVRVMLLCLVRACGSMACAPKLIGPTIPSGYFFSLWVSDPEIWLLLEGSSLEEHFPRVAELTVRVQNAQGQPVDGVPVTFQVEPAWIQDASVIPQRAITRGGVAQAVFRAVNVDKHRKRTKGGDSRNFNVRSLRGQWDAPPYFHDGRARTLLRDVITMNVHDAHGITSGLTPQDIDDLAAFVQSIE
ncbi:MAG: Ig-like domain-containing protein [Candidatus Tectomicrobia bacterium]